MARQYNRRTMDRRDFVRLAGESRAMSFATASAGALHPARLWLSRDGPVNQRRSRPGRASGRARPA